MHERSPILHTLIKSESIFGIKQPTHATENDEHNDAI